MSETLNDRLAIALKHVNSCAECARFGVGQCEHGQKGLAALDEYESTAPPVAEPVSDAAEDAELMRRYDSEREDLKCIAELRAALSAATAERDALRAETSRRGQTCACTLATPCSYACSCAKGHMSGGCRRCCTYGSADQRKAMAEHIAAKDARPAVPIADCCQVGVGYTLLR